VKTVPRPPLPSLQDELDRITQNTRALVQPERLAISEQASEDLFATGIEDRILPVGARTPEFTLPDALTGKPVHSTDLLALGPLVIKFFRGRWCPYCVTELEVWRDLHAEIRSMGALLVAISPQTPRQNDFTLQQHELPFPILSDTGAALAEQFGIAYSVPEAHRSYYQGILVNLPFVNSGSTYKNATESSWHLPLPALFVVKQDGTVAFSEAHADFRVRPEPADVLSVIASF
jgi:peroxiredoxin